MTGEVLEGVLTEAGAQLEDAIDLRRRIHRHPELGLDLPETQATVLEALDGLGLQTGTGTATTSVVAILDGDEPGPTVLLRADMDALPVEEDTGLEFASRIDGAMHACGHDAHTAMLVAAARLLAARRAGLRGRVAFMFQPGEEGHHGARHMLEEGLLAQVTEGAEPVSLAFAIHQSPNIPSGMVATRRGPLLASTDELKLTVRGRGGHASMPHQAGDPIPVACEIVSALQTMVTRRVDVFDPVVLTITKLRAGTTTNVIPETATMWGTIRTVSARTRAAAPADLERVASGIAAAHGVTVELELEEGYPVTVNHDEAADFVLESAARVLGEQATFSMPAPIMGSEDWSYVLAEVPGAMAFLGTRPPGLRSREVAPNHSNRMVLDETAMAPGIATYAAVALRRLNPLRR
jgi:hippurate hydrolase